MVRVCCVVTAVWIADIKLHSTVLSVCVDQLFNLKVQFG